MVGLGLLVLLHLYIGWRIAPALPGLLAPSLFVLLLLVIGALIPAAFLGRRAPDRAVADRWSWAGMLSLGVFAILLVLTLGRDALLALDALWPGPPLWPPLRDASAAAVPILGAIGVGIGLLNARRTAGVRTVDVPIAGLPPALAGFTIVQISDIHVGPTVKRGYLQAIVERVNALDADVVAVTGDLVDGRVADLADDVAPLAALRARHGAFFVTGNHEYYSGAPEWIAQLRAFGLRVLLNEHVVIEHGGATLVLAGVTDFSAHHFDRSQRSDPQRAIAGAPPAAARVLLAHQPRSAAGAQAAGFQLQLSGHTHGGQIWPFNHFVPLQQPFTAGLHRLGSMWVYTSRGTGYWGPPLRLGAPSEITRVRLVPG